MYAFDTWQFEKAANVYKRFRTDYPRNALAWFMESAAVQRLGQREYAKRLLEQAIALEPTNHAFADTVVVNDFSDGELGRAEIQVERSSRGVVCGWTECYRAAVAFGRFDGKAVLQGLERMRTTAPTEYQALAYDLEGCFHCELGNLEAAADIVSRGMEFTRQRGLSSDILLGQKLLLAGIYRVQNRLPVAVDVCRDALRSGTGIRDTMRIGGLLARLGDISSARACDVDCPGLAIYRHWQYRLRGEIALARGDSQEALDWMRRAPGPGRTGLWPEHIARAAVIAKDFIAARGYFKELFANPGWYWLQANRVGAGYFRWALEYVAQQPSLADLTGATGPLRSMLQIN